MLALVFSIAFYSPKPDLGNDSKLLVVLGAGYTHTGEPVLALEKRLDKTLYLNSLNTMIMVSGREEEVHVMEDYLEDNGINKKNIIRDIHGMNTRSTVKNAFNISQQTQTSPTFISQAYHLPRIRLYAYTYGKGVNANFVATDRVKLPLNKLLYVSFREIGAITAFPYLYIIEELK